MSIRPYGAASGTPMNATGNAVPYYEASERDDPLHNSGLRRKPRPQSIYTSHDGSTAEGDPVDYHRANAGTGTGHLYETPVKPRHPVELGEEIGKDLEAVLAEWDARNQPENGS